MKGPVILFSVLIAALVFTAACGGDDGPSDEKLQQGLQVMVLQPSEVPEGLQGLGGSFADNAQAASGLGSGPTKEQLDAIGRILGYSSEYVIPEPGAASAPVRVVSDVTLYKTAQGATDSFNDRVTRARAADWQTSHSGLTEFQQEEVEKDLGADESYWLHLTGYQQTGSAQKRLVSDDQIVFRIGRATGFLNVVSLAAPDVDDRSFAENTVEALLLKQIEHTRNGLDSGLLD